jgi:hypothetical protein
MTTAQSGVVAFQIPARMLEICVWAQANSKNGMALKVSPTRMRWRQVCHLRGRPVRRIARNPSSTTAPRATRLKATWAGVSASSPTSMKRKDDPHTRVSRR